MEKMYCFERRNLPKATRALLDDIDFKYNGKMTARISEETLKFVLDSGYEVIYKRRVPHALWDLKFIRFKKKRENGRKNGAEIGQNVERDIVILVTRGRDCQIGRDIDNTDEIKLATKTILNEKIDRPIKITLNYNYDDRQNLPDPKRYFHIVINPQAFRGNRDNFKKIFKTTVNIYSVGRDNGAWFDGKPIMDGLVEIAAFDTKMLVIYPLLKLSEPVHLKVYKKILEKMIEQFDDRKGEDCENAYIKRNIAADRVKKTMIKKKINKTAEKVETAEKILKKLKIKHVEELYQLDVTSRPKKYKEKAFAEEFNRLLADKRISKIQIRNNYLTIFTNGILATHPESSAIYNIGKLRIEIPFKKSDQIRIFNLTNVLTDNNQDAPHVRAGSPCFGNLSSTVSDLLNKQDYVGLVSVLFEFLENPNTNDGWGQNLILWPKIKEKNAKKKKEKKKK